jgi:hypothetical protein
LSLPGLAENFPSRRLSTLMPEMWWWGLLLPLPIVVLTLLQLKLLKLTR